MAEIGHFYFLDAQYFIDFPDKCLIQNKSTNNNPNHDRPCFCAFLDKSTGLYWMIPISSQVGKFQKIYADKVKKYGKCDTIMFGNVLGHTKAFLIQNMCPVTDSYIHAEYIDKKSGKPVRIDGRLEKKLIQTAKKVLTLHRRGTPLIFSNVLNIEKYLIIKEAED